MKLIVGLGNPGERYETTRHNLGFLILEHFLKDIEPVNKSNWREEAKFKSEMYSLEYKPKKAKPIKVILVKPLTFMNNSGMSVRLISNYYKIKPEDIWIVHDELDLPLGFIKIRNGGSAAGHRGVESIIKDLSTDKFWRFRIGVGKEKLKIKNGKSKVKRMESYVLRGFGKSEKGTLKHVIKKGAKALQTALDKDLTTAMNKFNTK